MAFNWFRRQFTQPSSESSPEPSESPAVEAQESATKAEAAIEPAPDEDYLQWAKAAYQNIQQRQQAEQPEVQEVDAEAASPGTQETEATEPQTGEEPAPEPPPPIGIESVEAADLSREVPVETPPPAPEPEPVRAATPAKTTAPEAGIAKVEDQAPDPQPESQTPEMEPTGPGETPDSGSSPGEESAAPVPFWAQAETERQARLERLRETAIAEPDPEEIPQPVAATVAPHPAGEAPPLDFDEGFLWSAEVLANQGRRPEEISLEEITWLKRLRQGLDKTRRSLVNQLKAIVGQGPLNQEAVLEIETLLLQADAGVVATDTIIEALQSKLREEVLPPEAAIAYLKQILRNILDQPIDQNYSPTFAPDHETLNIWLLTGVNGVGKTTTIGKIAHLATESGYESLIAAADTFRAAAVEQVRIWGERSGVKVIANPGQNTDPAAVVFDAIAAAQARDTELLLVDTAGRLQNKQNLMDELKKIRRIIDKKASGAKIESLLVLDATLGQNGLRQAEVFAEAAQLTGVILTKLDGTAKGGVALAVVQQLGLPIRFIGAGEGIRDLRPFSSYEFVEALLSG